MEKLEREISLLSECKRIDDAYPILAIYDEFREEIVNGLPKEHHAMVKHLISSCFVSVVFDINSKEEKVGTESFLARLISRMNQEELLSGLPIVKEKSKKYKDVESVLNEKGYISVIAGYDKPLSEKIRFTTNCQNIIKSMGSTYDGYVKQALLDVLSGNFDGESKNQQKVYYQTSTIQ